MHVAASSKKGTRCLDHLLDDTNNLNEICNTHLKATPIHFACIQSNIKSVRSLCRKGANINMTDYLGNTPIMYATENGNLEIIKTLISYDADALKKNQEGLNAIQIAIHQGNRNVKMYYLGLEKYKHLNEQDFI